MIKDENPDFTSSDEDFKKSMEMVENDYKSKKPKRKRKVITD